MPELVIPVGENIGPGYIDWETWEYIPGFTVNDVKMRLQYAEYDGIEVDSILLQFGICYGGSTRHAMDTHNYLRSLGIPIRAHVMSVTASSGTIVALAADEIELEHTAQWMVHRPLFSEGSQSQRSEEIRADADRLDREEQAMVDLYVARTGKTEEEVRALIAVDRFMSATEALDFGFATKVNPLKAKAPAAAAVQARLKTVRRAVARADRHALRTAKATTPKPKASTKPARKAATPRPMATTPKKKPAAKPAAQNRSSLTAAQKSAAQAVATLAKSLGVKATIEGIDAEEVEAVATATVLADGDGTLYTDGELAQGSEVFNDEELTEPTADGVYGTEDGRDITVAAGVVESVAETTDADTEEEEEPSSDIKALRKLVEDQNKTIADLQATFKKAVPPTPKATGTVQVPDAKTNKPKAKGLLAGASATK
jgi:ATP-dependent protease ClpP protease subunit